MSTPQMVPLDEADIASLRQFATVNLGLEIKPGTNGPSLRAKIQQADVSVSEIPMFVPEGAGTPRSAPPTTSARDGAVKQKVQVEATANGQPLPTAEHVEAHAHDPLHHSHDPRVRIKIFKSDDRRRSKVVNVSVNGVLFRMQRDQEIDVPYRVYEALEEAKEKAAVDGDDINPMTGEPIKVWADVQSYPFTVVRPASDEAVAEWRAMTAKGFQQTAA